MKRYKATLLVTLFTWGIPVLAAPPAQANLSKEIRGIELNIRQKKYSEAFERAQTALQQENLSIKDKVSLLNAAGKATVLDDPAKFEAARPFFEQVLNDPSIDNVAKVTTYSTFAEAYIDSLYGQYLDKMNLAPAYEILNRALNLPDLQPEEEALALKNIGDLYEREDRDREAIQTYERALKLKISDSTKDELWKSMADVYVKQSIHGDRKQGEKAVNIYKQRDFALVPLYKRLGEYDKAIDLLVDVLDAPQATDSERWAAFKDLPVFRRLSPRRNESLFISNLATLHELSSKYLPALAKEDPNRGSILWDTFSVLPDFYDTYYYRDAYNPSYVAWAGPLLLNAQLSRNAEQNKQRYEIVYRKYSNALIALGQLDEATQVLQKADADATLDAPSKFWAKLVLAGLSSKDIRPIVQAESALPDGAKAQEVLAAARSILQKDEGAAKAFYAVYEGIVPQKPTATIKANFVPRSPRSVEGWLAAPSLRSKPAKFDRRYGDNLKTLLETDAASGDRGIGASDGKDTGDTDTDFHIATDARGIYMFIFARDAHAQKVVDGLMRGGSIEMYFAPGKDQPYYWFLPRFPSGKITVGPTTFQTMYPNSSPGWRSLSYDNGTFDSETLPIEGGFGVSMFFSWDLFYDKLPVDGTKWRFEAIRFTRSGGYSFGGSQSVHNPSDWGDIVFTGMTPQNRTAIKRNIIFRALARYNDAKRVINPVGRWADKELGDPAFYSREVAPLLATLDGYAKMVGENMTDTTVEDIYRNAVPGWMEIEHQVAALRTNYLKEKLTAR